MNAVELERNFYRQQCDELGTKVIRLMGDQTRVQREANRHRLAAELANRVYRLGFSNLKADELGQKFIELVVDALNVDHGLLLRYDSNRNKLVAENSLGFPFFFQKEFQLSEEPADFCYFSGQSVSNRFTRSLEQIFKLPEFIWIFDQKTRYALLAGDSAENGHPPPTFREDDRIIVQQALSAFVRVLQHRRADEKREYRLDYEKLISTISTYFINLSFDKIDRGINHALHAIGEFVHADRSYVFLRDQVTQKFSNRYEWCASGVESQRERFANVPEEMLASWLSRMRGYQPIVIRDGGHEASDSQNSFLRLKGSRALLIVPMIYGKSLFGFMGLDSIRRPRTWQEDEISLLRLMGSVFLNVLERKSREERLQLLNECYLSLTADPNENINRFVSLCGEVLGAKCAVYNRYYKGILCSIGQWNTPDDFDPIHPASNPLAPQGQKHRVDELSVVHLSGQPSADPLYQAHFQTVVSRRVEDDGEFLGTLQIFFQHEYEPEPADRWFVGAVAAAIRTEEKRKANRNAKDAETPHGALLATTANATLVLDDDASIVLANRELEQLSGYSKTELEGRMNLIDLVVPEDVEKVLGYYQRRKENAEAPRYLEFRLLDKSSAVKDIYMTMAHIPGSSRCVASLMDISDFKKAERALEESEQKYRLLVDNAHESIVIVQDGEIKFVNHQMAHLSGYEESELLSRPFIELLHAEDRATLATGDNGKWIQTMAADGVNFRLVHRNGEAVWLMARALDLKWNGLPAHILFLEDITEQRDREHESRAETRETLEGIVQALATTMERKDPYTAGHQRRVTKLACAIAREIGLDEERIKGIEVAGILHDIGKLYVPAEILNKPGQLSALEMDFIKTHPQVGYDILKSIKFPWPVAEAILQHHERLDGSGYPQGLKGEEILLEARIFGVADVFETIASHRPYRPALGRERAFEELITGRGTLYDPQIVDACIRLLKEKNFQFK